MAIDLADRENLRQALRWISEQPKRDAQTIEHASRRFDLSPMDEDFLLRHFLDHNRQETGAR